MGSNQNKEDRQDYTDSNMLAKKYAVHKEYSEIEINNFKKLIFIFRRSAEFFSLKDLLKLLCLNKYIGQHIKNSEWEMIISIKACLEFINENYQSDFIRIFQDCDINYHNIYNNFPKSENLLKNPCGEHGSLHWEVDGDWRFSKKGTWKNKSRCFCTSYNWARLSQDIELKDEKCDKILLAKSYVARRVDCPSSARIRIRGFEYWFSNVIFDSGEFIPPDNEVGNDPSCGYMTVGFLGLINPKLTKIKVTLAGRGNHGWRGYYGPRFGYTDIRIINI